jgi:membrane fusion protein (multidrug efflux system)
MTRVFPLYRQTLVALGLVAALNSGYTLAAGPTSPSQARAVAVDAVTIKPRHLELTSTLPGRTSAYRDAEVRPQVDGIVTKRLFVEGSMVKKGDVLFQIDPATYEVALQSARATLASAEAALESAKLQSDRYKGLIAKRAISQQDYEDSQASYRQALATVMSAKASVKSAQINLDYTKIKAPISGQIGLSTISEGALVTANQTSYLTTIQQLDPLYVDIAQTSSAVMKLRKQVSSADKLGGINLTLDDGTVVDQKATLQFADVSVNEATGTVTLRALVPNPDGVLLPGLYVRAEVPTEIRNDAILVPQAAISRDVTGKAHVMVVGSDNKVVDTVIEASRVVGQSWLVESGLNDGDVVIVNGLQKVKSGSEVTINPIDMVNPAETVKGQ